MTTVGIAGAGTMGAGIAALASEHGLRTIVHDPAQPGRAALEDLAAADIVIEAVPEDLGLKRTVFADLARVVRPDCVLATNTSSLSVTALAAEVPSPERVVGMHFFNPPSKMRLVEVVAGEESGQAALAAARSVAEAMGKHVIDAADGPGFIVNRCNRPFGLEALRIVQERLATPEQVDRICRMAGGFRMGPFELMDLVGLDVGLAVSRSFYEQSFGEPRWRPSVLAARMVAGGRLGRKSGRGWYAYPPGRPPDPSPPARGGGSGLVVIAGDTALAEELREAAASAGWDAVEPAEAEGEVPALIVDCGETEDDTPLQGAHQVVLCDQAPLAELDPGGGSAGFSLLPPLGRLAELTVQETTAPGAVAAAERFFGTLGMVVERVGDAPGLVLARIVVGLVNEACFAVGEGVGSEADVDAGMVLGLNHPRGPFEWGATVGFDVVAGLLAGLWEEYRSECYRPAPELLRRVRTSTPH